MKLEQNNDNLKNHIQGRTDRRQKNRSRDGEAWGNASWGPVLPLQTPRQTESPGQTIPHQ